MKRDLDITYAIGNEVKMNQKGHLTKKYLNQKEILSPNCSRTSLTQQAFFEPSGPKIICISHKAIGFDIKAT